MSLTTIRTDGLGKAYRIPHDGARPDNLVEAATCAMLAPFRNFRRLRGLNTFANRPSQDDVFWALKDISFEVTAGETVGFIGANGAGKSTLLKVLSRITQPTEGMVQLRGRVSSLLEVGTAFHPELSGRDNIYMNGTILGMSRPEINRKFDEIVAFSGVERFLDMPIKRYSSGMKVRLGFSVAAHLEPDVMIVDEVLSVGDADFQKRCLGKMDDVAKSGRTILFVSHNMGAIQTLCSRAIHLKDGRVAADGAPDEVVRGYLSAFTTSTAVGFGADNEFRETTGRLRFTGGALLDDTDQEVAQPIAGDPLIFQLDIANDGERAAFRVRLIVKDDAGTNLFSLHSAIAGAELVIDRQTRVQVCVDRLPLPPGRYRVGAAVISAAEGMSERIPNAFVFDVDTSTFFEGGKTPPKRQGHVLVAHDWRQIEPPATQIEGKRARLG